MEFLRKIRENPTKALKIAAAALVGVIVLGAVLGALSPERRGMGMGWGGVAFNMVAPMAPSYDMAESRMFEEKMMATQAAGAPALSYRNAMPYYGGGTTGSDAEAFEVTEYSATIETGDLEATCGAILSLKAKDYVVFESSNSYDRGCDHVFKVERKSVNEVLTAIEKLDPRDLSENVRTIKNQVEDFTSQTDILKSKLSAIDQTLKSAMAAYDEITAIATRSQDTGALAKIIDSKVGIIERLTQERININSQLDYLAQAKARELDKLDYTYFRVSVYENKYVDGRSIGDSWKQAVRDFVYDINRIIQEITVGLVAFVFVVIQWLVYIAIALVVAKYGWRAAKSFWRS
ncbi:MAG: hypothetical protein HZA81_03875 [Candidatus Taylorbacteria bacterium]|nr:hypothetical protein [Candidatus Taylorbacteria bacterium]